jgi:hypothetical protein
MQRIFLQTLAASTLLLVGAALSAQVPNEQIHNPFYSADQYRNTHSLFDRVRNDLYRAQTDAYPNYLGDSPRFDLAHNDLRTLEQNWDKGVFDSNQMADTIKTLQMVLNDNRLMPHDRDVLANDLSRLMDFQSEYF